MFYLGRMYFMNRLTDYFDSSGDVDNIDFWVYNSEDDSCCYRFNKFELDKFTKRNTVYGVAGNKFFLVTKKDTLALSYIDNVKISHSKININSSSKKVEKRKIKCGNTLYLFNRLETGGLFLASHKALDYYQENSIFLWMYDMYTSIDLFINLILETYPELVNSEKLIVYVQNEFTSEIGYTKIEIILSKEYYRWYTKSLILGVIKNKNNETIEERKIQK